MRSARIARLVHPQCFGPRRSIGTLPFPPHWRIESRQQPAGATRSRTAVSLLQRISMVDITASANRVIRRHGKTVILLTMCLGVFIAQLDSQVVNLAIKHIGSDLKVDISRLQWVMDAYNLCYAT